MTDVQVYDGQGEKPAGESIAEKPDPLLFEKRVIAALEAMAMDLKDIFAACRDNNGNSNTFMALDQLMTRLKSMSSSHSYVYEDLIRKLKKDLGLNEWEPVKLPNTY